MNQTPRKPIVASNKIAELISNNLSVLFLLEHLGIEIPVKDKTIAVVCKEFNINPELFLILANLYNGTKYTPLAPLTVNDIFPIISYLKNSHTFYSNEVYPNISATIQEMTKVNDHKEMAMVQKFFEGYYTEVSEHFGYENEIVFPYILGLYESMGNTGQNPVVTRYTVKEYKDHHSNIEEKLYDLKNLLIKYLPSKNDQTIRRKLLFMLSELEYDLKIHAEIEDVILIPLVASMETHLKGIL